MKDRIVIFDTTLRDGEQSPGASMTREEKVRIARLLEKMRVDVIEAGFPAASDGDFAAVQAVASMLKESVVCGLARANSDDIDRAAAAIKPAKRGRIHTFIATSPIHMQHKLMMSPEEVVERAVAAVKRARNATDDVEFSAEDAGRSDFDFLCRIFEAAIDAGATTINVPDTVGYTLPGEFSDVVGRLIETIPNADKAVFSVHCHNDLGLAVANSLAAVQRGARQIECTINGLGERAGNTALEEVVMAIRTRSERFDCDTRIDTTQIVPTSRLVSAITGFPVQPNKAIVGANAFAHEAGIHQDGVIKHRETYEIMRAEDVGWHANRMVLGKHSGRNAFATRSRELGIDYATQQQLDDAFRRFKALADRKHEIFDDDLQAIATEQGLEERNEVIQLVSMTSTTDSQSMPSASVTLTIDGVEYQGEGSGSGPVDATFKVIKALCQVEGVRLDLYSVNAITQGTDSQGEVTVRLESPVGLVNGQGADTDIIVASARAYISALNKVLRPISRDHPQPRTAAV
ncbi:2-isopropylmalate synthase [Gammaproteobacteria bacterium]|nr:2-isopropylmalate synthase [Gammaproteobacteria bacterium]